MNLKEATGSPSAVTPTGTPSGGTGSLKDMKRRLVFKPVLDNPYTQSNLWPFITPEVAAQIMDYLSVVLSGLGSYNQMAKDKQTVPDVPSIQKQITIGFNSTVLALEKQASIHRARLLKRRKVVEKDIQKDIKKDEELYIKYVFVTKFDISPTVLTDPFPVLSFTSSQSGKDRVKLIQLPRGSMSKLSKLLHLDNVGIIGLSGRIVEAGPLYGLIATEVKDVEVPWLNGLFDDPDSIFMKPAISFLKTSAPIIPKKNDQKQKKEK